MFKKQHIENFCRYFSVFFLFSCVFSIRPFLVFLNSRGEVNISISEVLYLSVVVLATCFVACSLLFFILTRVKKQNLVHFFTALVLALAILFWVQGYCFLWDYGPFDGTALNYAQYKIHGVFEILIWLSVLFVFCRSYKKIFHHAHKISLIFLVVLAVTTINTYRTSFEGSELLWCEKYQPHTDYFLQYSSDKNVILLVLDASRGDVFETIYESLSSDEKSLFDGFTFFKNTTGTCSKTNPAMTGIFTSLLYDYKRPAKDAYKEMFLSDFSIPFQLKKNGFLSDMHPYSTAAVYLDPTTCDNLHIIGQDKNLRQDNEIELGKILLISKFNFTPHYLKIRFFSSDSMYAEISKTSKTPEVVGEAQFQSSSLSKKYQDLSDVVDDPKLPPDTITHLKCSREVVQNLASKLYLSPQPIFKYLHFHGAHLPFFHDEHYVGKKQVQNRDAYRKQMQGAIIYTLGALIDSLKKKGVYDQTMLIVIGDHGLIVTDSPQELEMQKNNYALLQQTLRPMLLIKPFNTPMQPLSVSNAPVSLFDIPQTVFDAVGIKVQTKGRSVFDVKEKEKRIRHAYGVSRLNDWSIGFGIDGDVVNLDSWSVDSYFFIGEGKKEADRELLNERFQFLMKEMSKVCIDNFNQ